MLTTIIIFIASYLIGSIASAILVCKIMGKPDPRSEGSGNPGATNILRLHGKNAAIFTLLGDALKGFIPVFIVNILGFNEMIIALAGLGAFLGHLYPVFFQFRGGKGVATFVGLLFAGHWLFGSCFAAIWFSMAALFRYSSLAALTAAVLIPVIAFIVTNAIYLSASYAFMSILLLWRHQANIKHLLAGTEGKLGAKKG